MPRTVDVRNVKDFYKQLTMTKKIKKMSTYDYPVELVEPDIEKMEDGNIKIVREPFEHAVINKVNEIIQTINND